MTNAAFELAEEIHVRKLEFKLHTGIWERFNKTGKVDLSISNWKCIKYLDTTATTFHADIASIPNRVGV